jgi:cardiolipin synthase
MYWVGVDAVGTQFRDRLVSRARAGVAVFVVYDAIGSLGMFRSFWSPLVEAGGRVVEHGPVAPWRRHFRVATLLLRDHRKLLVVDGEVGFCGGLNLALPWLPREQGGEDWRDDVIEARGPIARRLRGLVCESLRRLGEKGPARDAPIASPKRGVWVLANVVGDGSIRRAYLHAIRRARTSIDIRTAYFLPSLTFLRALTSARKRGVRVRVILPGVSDVWAVSLAMLGIIDRLVRAEIEVYGYERSILHAKTAVIDEHLVIIGSHNLDDLSRRFAREANVFVDDRDFALEIASSFEDDLKAAARVDAAQIGARSLYVRVLARIAARFRTIL